MNDNNDHSFDFFIYSLSYQPEFCRENHERFVGCKDFQENWEGQLTIHGLWPSVSVCTLHTFIYIMCVIDLQTYYHLTYYILYTERRWYLASHVLKREA